MTNSLISLKDLACLGQKIDLLVRVMLSGIEEVLRWFSEEDALAPARRHRWGWWEVVGRRGETDVGV